jgi:DNA-binding NarL/FixJ family response regulator
MPEPEIAWRFKSSPRHIQRTLRLIEVPRSPREDTGSPATTALERTVLKARRRGVSHAEIGARLRRSPGFVARVEKFVALRAENSAES